MELAEAVKQLAGLKYLHGKPLPPHISPENLQRSIQICLDGGLRKKVHKEFLRHLETATEHLLAIKQDDPSAFYEIPTPTHEAFHRSMKKYRVFDAANRCRKTTSGLQEVYWWLTRTHPYRKIPDRRLTIWWVTVDYKNYVEQVAYTKFIVGEPEDPFSPRFPTTNPYGFTWKADKHEIVNAAGDSLLFKSTDKGVAKTKFASASVDLIVVDEPIDGRHWGELEARLWTSKGGAIFLQTATEGLDWVWETFIAPHDRGERHDVDYFTMSQYDVPWFTSEDIDSHIASIMTSGEGNWGVRVRIHGERLPFTESPVFDFSALSDYRDSLVAPLWAGEITKLPGKKEPLLQPRHKGRLRKWADPEPGHTYLIGADPAMGQGGSFASATVIDIGNLETPTLDIVADWHGDIDADLFGEHVLVPLANHFNEATIWCENNNHGKYCITAMLNARYPRLGAQRRSDLNAIHRMGDQRKNNAPNFNIGVSMNRKTKPIVFDILRAYVRDRIFSHLPKELLDELASINVEGEDETIFKSQTTTDRVMSLGIALYGRELSHTNRAAKQKKQYKNDVQGRLQRKRDKELKRIKKAQAKERRGFKRILNTLK